MSSPSSSTPRSYTVTGMTCSHCVASVQEEVSELAGVRTVDVDLVTGRLTVSGDAVADDAVAGAVRKAGYELVGVRS